MISQSHERQTNEVAGDQTKEMLGEWIDSIEHLIRWIGPRTIGRERVLQRMADVKKAQRETHRLQDALSLLSRELDTLYPPGAVISLAKRRVHDVALSLAHT